MAKSSYREILTSLTEDGGDASDRYRDFANVPNPGTDVASSKGNRNEQRARKSEFMFPSRLHYMLSDIESDESTSDIIRWQPHGRGFVVLDRKKLETDVLPMWFNQSKIESFFKQLNLYGFKRINFGRDKGCYYHELFLRGKPFLAEHIKSKPGSKSSMRVRRESPETEPDFFSMPVVEHEAARSNSPILSPAEEAHASEDGALPLEDRRCANTSSLTTLNSIPTAGLQALGGPDNSQALRYLVPQAAYPSMPPLMAVGAPMWLYSNGQAPFPAPVAGIPPASINALGGAHAQYSPQLGPGGIFPHQAPVPLSTGATIPPYVYAAVPVAMSGVPLFYGQGESRFDRLSIPHYSTDGALHSAILTDHSAREALVASRESTYEEKTQDHVGAGGHSSRPTHGSNQDPSSRLEENPHS